MTEVTGTPPAKRLGMVVDLNRCMGCWTCAVACKAENNVGAGLFWLRVLTIGGSDHIDVPAGEFPAVAMAYQPTGCFHCDNAPCVKACPVGATYRRADGIVMINYDTCIGCRYCMIACPYNRRYYNWSAPTWPGGDSSSANPDVAMRPAGVVEKCTLCQHRIRARYERARLDEESVTDAELQRLPACAASCPTEAITFGDLADEKSLIAQLARNPRAVRLLEHLGSGPKVFYLRSSR